VDRGRVEFGEMGDRPVRIGPASDSWKAESWSLEYLTTPRPARKAVPSARGRLNALGATVGAISAAPFRTLDVSRFRAEPGRPHRTNYPRQRIFRAIRRRSLPTKPSSAVKRSPTRASRAALASGRLRHPRYVAANQPSSNGDQQSFPLTLNLH
jgi:hypothetical protein